MPQYKAWALAERPTNVCASQNHALFYLCPGVVLFPYTPEIGRYLQDSRQKASPQPPVRKDFA